LRGALLATSVGEKKKTRFDWNALSTRPAAAARRSTPAPIHTKRRWRGFNRLLPVAVERRVGEPSLGESGPAARPEPKSSMASASAATPYALQT
jgi:hypothetical protein